MIKSGFRIIKDYPLTGVGPDMVIQVYPGYREPTAVSQRNPHLHNVPLQIAAERGLPALAHLALVRRDADRDFFRLRKTSPLPSLAAARHRLRRRDAGRRHVRIQFRRLRVPDAVPGARDAALRRRTRSGARRRTEGGVIACPRFPTLDELLDRLAGRSILVIGDLMLDHFVIGTVDRISPEAPVPVVRFDHETWRLGGAANVAHNIVALGGRVDAIGVVGSDADGARLLADLAGRSIGTARHRQRSSRCTTRKLRVVTTRNQQVARIDYEDDAKIDAAIEATVVQAHWRAGGSAQRDRHLRLPEGRRDSQVASAAADAARAHRIPLLVDPKVPHIDHYAGATVITPNHHEAEAVTHMRIRTAAEAREAARRFRERAGSDAVLITRGEHGMWLLGPWQGWSRRRNRAAGRSARSRRRDRRRRYGHQRAGARAAAGASLADAARLANRAAGIVVGKFGPATVTVDELRQSSVDSR